MLMSLKIYQESGKRAAIDLAVREGQLESSRNPRHIINDPVCRQGGYAGCPAASVETAAGLLSMSAPRFFFAEASSGKPHSADIFF